MIRSTPWRWVHAALLELQEGKFELEDSWGEFRTATQNQIPKAVIEVGKIYRQTR